MDVAQGGDLRQMIETRYISKEFLSEDKVLQWFTQACLALEYIHKRNIIHRDLKSNNIFFD